jgi:mutator protein MutT
MRNIVIALLLRHEQILLARRSPERRVYPDCWSFPGGHVEKGEAFDQALVRETREEIGVTPLAYSILSRIPDPSAKVEPVTYHLYAVREWSGQPAIMDKEHTELRWFSFEAAASLPDLALEEFRPLLSALGRSTTGLF